MHLQGARALSEPDCIHSQLRDKRNPVVKRVGPGRNGMARSEAKNQCVFLRGFIVPVGEKGRISWLKPPVSAKSVLYSRPSLRKSWEEVDISLFHLTITYPPLRQQAEVQFHICKLVMTL